MDCDLFGARDMAQMEELYVIRTSYYILQTAPYFGYRRRHCLAAYSVVLDLMRDIYDLGHETGDHNDLLSLMITNNIQPKSFYIWWSDVMRQKGMQLIGSASHGSAEARQYGFMNLDIFQGVTTGTYLSIPDKGVFPLGFLTLEECGLEYEAYSLRKDFYLSEAGGRWKDNRDPEFYLDSISTGKRVIILTHPEWWAF